MVQNNRPMSLARTPHELTTENHEHRDPWVDDREGVDSGVAAEGSALFYARGHRMMQNSFPNGSCITAHSRRAWPSGAYSPGGRIITPPISSI